MALHLHIVLGGRGQPVGEADRSAGEAMLAIAMALFHIYLGTIGMRGAYEGMRYGYVDEAWAKEHHEYWYNDVMAGREPRGPVSAPVVVRHKTA